MQSLKYTKPCRVNDLPEAIEPVQTDDQHVSCECLCPLSVKFCVLSFIMFSRHVLWAMFYQCGVIFLWVYWIDTEGFFERYGCLCFEHANIGSAFHICIFCGFQEFSFDGIIHELESDSLRCVFWLSRRSLEEINFVLVPVSVLALDLAPVPILAPVLFPCSRHWSCSRCCSCFNRAWVCVHPLFILNWPSQKFLKKACVWGAGGAAQAVLYALLTLQVKEILVINRTLDKARGMIVGVERGKSFFFVSGSFILSRGLVVGDGKRIRSRLWPLC